MRSIYIKLLSIILISCLGFIVYSNTFHCSFHFDDIMFTSDNLAIRNIQNVVNIWKYYPCRFVTFYSFAINYYFNRFDVLGFHLFNLGVHLVSAVLVWWLTLLTLSTPSMKREAKNPITGHANLIALFAGLVFVSHPLQTQAITYIWQRTASMTAMFYVASLCFYSKARLHMMDSRFRGNDSRRGGNDIGRVYYIGALLTAIVAMLTKETAVTLPLMILLYEFTFLRSRDAINGVSTNWRYLSPFLLTILIIPLITFITNSTKVAYIQGAIEVPGSISPMQYILTEFRVMVTYIRLFFVPINQNLDYDYHISKSIFELPTLFSFLFFIVILIWARRLFPKYRLISFSILWVFLTSLPEANPFPIKDVIFEHRLYLPLAGYSLFLVSGVYYLSRDAINGVSTTMIVMALTMIIACNSVLTYERNKVWRDEVTLWSDTAAKSPHKARPYFNLGNVYAQQGNFVQALFNLNKGLAIDPDYRAEPYINRAAIYAQQGNFAQALSDLNKSIKINPYYPQAYSDRGFIYDKQGNYAQAISDYTKAIETGPHDEKVYVNRGQAYAQEGNFIQAMSDLNKAMEINPNKAENFNIRGSIYVQQGNLLQAISDYNKAIEINPRYAEVYFNRGSIYARQNNITGALSDYNKAIEINPNFEKAYNNRGLILDKQGDPTGALSDYNKAIEINPRYAEAYTNRGTIDFIQNNFTQAISDFTKAIEINPRSAVGYNNRAVSYNELKEYDKAWDDARKARELGYPVNPGFISALRQATGAIQN